MNADSLPLWAQGVVAVLVLLGAAMALVGSMGLLRLPTFFERIHAPAIIATGATWCVMWACVLFFSLQERELALYPLLIALFMALTTPVTSIFLMLAALFRARQAGQNVPSKTRPPSPQDKP